MPISPAADGPAPEPRDWATIPGPVEDLRLVVCDMDGTLLDDAGQPPAELPQLVERMQRAGVLFVPASGRQYATLEHMFGGVADSFIAENGSIVVHHGEVIATRTLPRDVVTAAVHKIREVGAHTDLGVVACGVKTGWTERNDAPFLAGARMFYRKLEVVEDLTAVDDEIMKFAMYDFGDARATVAHFEEFDRGGQQVVVSGPNWIDLMNRGVDKGVGLAALQADLGITPAQTAVFGDYLNDLALYPLAEWSFAMANGHPDVAAVANFIAPANTDNGVARVLDRILP